MICKNCFEILDDNAIVCTECRSSTIEEPKTFIDNEVKEEPKVIDIINDEVKEELKTETEEVKTEEVKTEEEVKTDF
jgi:hypothetical protein